MSHKARQETNQTKLLGVWLPRPQENGPPIRGKQKDMEIVQREITSVSLSFTWKGITTCNYKRHKLATWCPFLEEI